ncbi:MAG: hypothetical protein K6C35_09310 [Eubacterium sp.]|nr:hypothetical protein [Eubacterium sp.]
MKRIYKDYLFDKHILVSEGKVTEDDHQFETLFTLANLFNIRITAGEKYIRKNMIKQAERCLGRDVPEPFYRGFPGSVRSLTEEQLIFDQLVHYTCTYGFGDFSEAGHSLFEKEFERTAFKENVEIKDFIILTEAEAFERISGIVNDLLSGTRPLSDLQFDLVENYIADYEPEIPGIASKNTCIKLLMDTRDLRFTDFLMMSDVIKLVDEMNFRLYYNTNIKRLNLRNQDRKFITKVINKLFDENRVDLITCYEKKKIWNGILHHIHYSPITPEALKFTDAMRGNTNESVFSEFEKHMSEKNIEAAVDALKKGKGSAAILRKLDYIVSRCRTEEELSYVLDAIETENTIVLMQLILRYSLRKDNTKNRIFRFTKYNMMKAHSETDEEAKRRRSVVPQEQEKVISEKLLDNLKRILKGKLGKVYIDPDMKHYALPVQENTSQGGFGVLTRGSRLPIPEAKKLRAFTYWEKVNDIDLSAFGITSTGKRYEFSWRTMSRNQSEAITYSGDETSGYNGGSEYFDIDLDKFREKMPDVRYIIFCNNVYSGLNFENVICRAGYMLRDKEDSGQIYEPKTISSAYNINCPSTFAYLFGIDLETNEFVWLNMAQSGSATVAGETSMDFILDYFHVTDILNVHSFFEMLATEVTDDISEAEVVVTDKNISVEEGKTLIREYDFEQMIKLMNR